MVLRLLPPVEDPGVKRAAVYVRMSTDKQVYSIEHQLAAIGEFAAREGLVITHTYADPGRSGLTLKGRPALTALLEDIARGPDFEVLLVYDVSRWGRFQDVDESAYHEYRIRRAGVRVIYCAEPFENDGSPFGSIVKGIKRAMAAEFSRELAVKISTAQRRIGALGYWQGAPPGFGLARRVISPEGEVKGLLGPGESKFLRADRIQIVHGDSEEVAVVRRIFNLYCQGHTRGSIARLLNAEGIAGPEGGPWSVTTVRNIQRNWKYAGHYIYGRRTSPLGATPRPTPPETWLNVPGAIEPIVSPEVFLRAQRIEHARSGRTTDDEMLERLKALLAIHGRLSGRIINADVESPNVFTYMRRFGGLLEAYRLIGWSPLRDYTSFVRSTRSGSSFWGAHRRLAYEARRLGSPPPPPYETSSPRVIQRRTRLAAKAKAADVESRGLGASVRPPHPGELLREHFLPAYGYSASSLAEALRIEASATEALLTGQAPMTREASVGLTRLFHTSAGLWLNLQRVHDDWRPATDSTSETVGPGM